MEGGRHTAGPMPQNPTAQRLGEILATRFPGSPARLYHEYLATLTPAYDHLLTYSRYDRIWRCTSQIGSSDLSCSEISLLASSVHAIDFDQQVIVDHVHYDGTEPGPMRDLQQHLTHRGGEHGDSTRCRIICAQHVTCYSMEALGHALSLDPNVFSHRIGTSFKEIEKSTGIDKFCGKSIKDIQSRVGAFEEGTFSSSNQH